MQTEPQNNPEIETNDDTPPVFNKWNQVYAFVLILHAFIIALFYFFTHAYA
ncbi:MAG: hypothetical protein R3E32_27110 [Chitinophagales bacterium]